MNARLYDPVLGRFLAPDPYVSSGLTNDFNRYVYCRNNPLMFTDPSGNNPLFWLGMLISTGISYLASVRETGYKDWTPHINAIGGGYSGANGFYGGLSFDGGMHFVNVGWNSGLTVGSTSYGVTNMQNVNFKGFEQTVIQAENNAKDKYYEYCRINNENTQRFNNWIEKHIIFESELRIDYGAQITGNIKAFGGKLGFNVEKDTSPIMQFNINYNNGWSPAVFESGFMNKSEYSYGILDNKYRNEWSGNLGVGYDKTYYSTNDFFSWGDMKSEKINYLFFSTTNLYNGHHDIYESQYTMDFGFNFAFLLGIQANIRFGYK